MTEITVPNNLKSIKLVVGLGNPGLKYSRNRHNIGFMVIEELAIRTDATFKNRCESETGVAGVNGLEFFFQKPLTFMNLSGDAVRKLCRREKISPAEVLVIYDDLDLKPGRMRIRFGGGSGGHNGIKSISERLGTSEYGRLRLGIGRPDSISAVADYVLQDFAPSEQEMVECMVSSAADAVLMLCSQGYEAAMNAFNGK
jgi:peptidyl-tRNA hydrolase, PTH1 family